MIEGRVCKFGENIDTDQIIPAVYLDRTDPAELSEHCMEGIDPDFPKRAKGAIIVAGANFGCGSSREHAPLAIKASGVKCVVAKSFARIFFRNSINIGLALFYCAEADRIEEGDILRVFSERGIIENITKTESYKTQQFPEFMQRIIDAGGLIEYAMGS
jgi:3-isopropylmalate/(R)-2-methylmalate dehydratase small subunit